MNNKNTYLSTITLNENGLNTPIKRYMQAELILNKTLTYAVFKRLHIERHTQTVSKGMERDISCKCKQINKSWGSDTYTRQNRL